MVDGFLQCPVAREDWFNNAFIVDDIVIISSVLMQRVANSPRNFNTLVTSFVKSLVCNFPNIYGDGYRKWILSYVDDIFAGAKTWSHAVYQQLFCMVVGATTCDYPLHNFVKRRCR